MARTNTTSHTDSDRTDLYQSITDKIITELEAGRVPWVQPWASSKASLDMPRNGKTGDRYSGINILILWDAVVANGFSRSEEHTSELQSLMRNSYAVFCLKKK